MKPVTQRSAQYRFAHADLMALVRMLSKRGTLMEVSQKKAWEIARLMDIVVPECKEDAHFYTYEVRRIDVEGFGQLRLTFNPKYSWREGAALFLANSY